MICISRLFYLAAIAAVFFNYCAADVNVVMKIAVAVSIAALVRSQGQVHEAQ